jgi:hypothetical protein
MRNRAIVCGAKRVNGKGDENAAVKISSHGDKDEAAGEIDMQEREGRHFLENK